MAPPSLPDGWKATSASYDTGTTPIWHLGMLTDKGKYVGVEEALGGVQDLVEQHVDENAVQGKDVTIGGETYQTWTDAGGDYAVSRTVPIEGGTESYLVVGTAPHASIRDFAGRWRAGRSGLPGDLWARAALYLLTVRLGRHHEQARPDHVPRGRRRGRCR